MVALYLATSMIANRSMEIGRMSMRIRTAGAKDDDPTAEILLVDNFVKNQSFFFFFSFQKKKFTSPPYFIYFLFYFPKFVKSHSPRAKLNLVYVKMLIMCQVLA